MDWKDYEVYTAITTEPLTVSELLTHLRKSSDTFSGDIGIFQSITPGSHSIATHTGTAIDVSGEQTLICLNAGAVGTGGSVAAKIQESDDNTNWQDFTGGAFTTVTATNDNAIQEKDYTGLKQYIRVLAVVAGAACEFSADVITKSGDIPENEWFAERITTAREMCEDVTRRGLATQTLDVYLDSFPCKDYIELPRPPLQSVTSMTYKDSAGTVTTMTANTDYLVDTSRTVGRIVLPYGVSWPSFTPWPVNPITIRIVTGYYSTKPVPKSIKSAMLLYAGFFDRNRDFVEPNDKTLETVRNMISRYRVGWF